MASNSRVTDAAGGEMRPPVIDEAREKPFVPAGLTSWLGFLTRVTQIQAREVIRAGIEPQLPFAALSVLVALDERDGLRQGELALTLLIKESNMTLLAKQLEADGFIERRSDSVSKRFTALWLTDLGKQIAKDLPGKLTALDRSVAHALSDAEYGMLIELLTRLFVSRL